MNNLNFNNYTLDNNPESHDFILQFNNSNSNNLLNFHEADVNYTLIITQLITH